MPASPIPFSVWRKIAMATWRPRTDPMIFAGLEIDATNLLRYLDEARAATGAHVTPVHLVGRAVAKVLEELPALNGRVVFGEFVPSPTIDVFYAVSLRTDLVGGSASSETDLSGAVVRNADRKTPWEQAVELTEKAQRIRRDEDPMFRQTKALAKRLPGVVLRPIFDTIGFVTEDLQLPIPLLGLEARPFGSVLVTNVGTYGLDAVWAALPTICHTPAGVAVGTIREKAVVVDHEVAVRPVLPIGAMIDHRYIDGYQGAVIAGVVRDYLEDPWRFDPLPAPAAVEELPGVLLDT